MKYRHLGQAGVQVSQVALGTWLTFGSALDKEAAGACLQAAVDHGINYIDTADVYAHGQSEQALGELVREMGLNRQHLVIASKVYWPMSDDVNDRGLSRKHVMESIEGTLRRLDMDYIDIYYCHRHDDRTPTEEVVRAMDDLIHQGKVLYWGTSVWSAGQIEAAMGTARRVNGYAPQVEQPRYNMLDRHIEVEIVATCARNGMGLAVWSPLAQGLLTGKYNEGIPQGSRGARDDWDLSELTEANVTKIRRLTALAADQGLTMAQLALAWILRRPEVSCVIVGATRPAHVLDNAVAGEVELPTDVLDEIERVLDNTPTPLTSP